MKANKVKIILIVLFMMSCAVTFLFSSFFELREIIIQEDTVGILNTFKDKKIIIGHNLNTMLISKGNILSGHLDKIENEIKKDVNIKEISIKRTGNNSLRVDYTKRVPIMCVLYDDYVIYFDYDGTIIDTSKSKNEKSVLIKGINLNSFHFGFNLIACNDMLEDISLLCKEIEKYDIANYTAIRTLIDEIEIKDANRIVIRYDNRLEILVDLTSNVKYNANVICSILSNISQKAKGYIDFTISTVPYFTPVP